MKKNLKAFGSMINIPQILIGLSVLFLGTLVYVVDRPPYQTYFVYNNFVNISFHNTLPNLFGFIGNSLPSFAHVFSFILITAGLLSCQKRGCLIICACWYLTDVIFELGQKFNSLFSKIIPNWFEGVPLLENTKSYFLYGTFDFIDFVAITIGTIIAYFVILSTNKSEKAGMV